MITWLRNLIYGKNYSKTETTVNPQITDAVTEKKKTTKTTKKTTAPKTTKKPPVKKTTTRKTK